MNLAVIFGLSHTLEVRWDCNTLCGGNAQKSARSRMRKVVPHRALTGRKREKSDILIFDHPDAKQSKVSPVVFMSFPTSSS